MASNLPDDNNVGGSKPPLGNTPAPTATSTTTAPTHSTSSFLIPNQMTTTFSHFPGTTQSSFQSDPIVPSKSVIPGLINLQPHQQNHHSHLLPQSHHNTSQLPITRPIGLGPTPPGFTANTDIAVATANLAAALRPTANLPPQIHQQALATHSSHSTSTTSTTPITQTPRQASPSGQNNTVILPGLHHHQQQQQQQQQLHLLQPHSQSRSGVNHFTVGGKSKPAMPSAPSTTSTMMISPGNHSITGGPNGTSNDISSLGLRGPFFTTAATGTIQRQIDLHSLLSPNNPNNDPMLIARPIPHPLTAPQQLLLQQQQQQQQQQQRGLIAAQKMNNNSMKANTPPNGSTNPLAPGLVPHHLHGQHSMLSPAIGGPNTPLFPTPLVNQSTTLPQHVLQQNMSKSAAGVNTLGINGLFQPPRSRPTLMTLMTNDHHITIDPYAIQALAPLEPPRLDPTTSLVGPHAQSIPNTGVYDVQNHFTYKSTAITPQGPTKRPNGGPIDPPDNRQPPNPLFQRQQQQQQQQQPHDLTRRNLADGLIPYVGGANGVRRPAEPYSQAAKAIRVEEFQGKRKDILTGVEAEERSQQRKQTAESRPRKGGRFIKKTDAEKARKREEQSRLKELQRQQLSGIPPPPQAPTQQPSDMVSPGKQQ